MPLHWPQAGVQLRPFLQQVHVRLSHLPLQLYLIFRRSCSGAAVWAIRTGTSPTDDAVQSQSTGGISFPRHACTWWYVLWLWKGAASVVGWSFFGATYPADVATFTSWNFSTSAELRLGDVGHPYIVRRASSPNFSISFFEEGGRMKVRCDGVLQWGKLLEYGNFTNSIWPITSADGVHKEKTFWYWWIQLLLQGCDTHSILRSPSPCTG